jgi:FHS family L-fucose permease-like MFS transporter
MNGRTLSTPAAIAVLSIIFFTWGALTCLNDVLIPHLKAVFAMNYAQTMLIQFTFFGTYFVMSIPSGRVVAHAGYKLGIIIGLLVAAAGALLFYPAAGAPSYLLFLVALFVLASGITLLQVAASPWRRRSIPSARRWRPGSSGR